MSSLKPFTACLCGAMLLIAASHGHAQQPAADLILTNGKIVTLVHSYAGIAASRNRSMDNTPSAHTVRLKPHLEVAGSAAAMRRSSDYAYQKIPYTYVTRLAA